MNQYSGLIDRRGLFAGSAAALLATVTGCRQESEPVAPSTERRDVPLRIALVGSDADAEVIRRGWGAVSEQPLSIETLSFDRAGMASLADSVLAAAKKSDLVVYPLAVIPAAAAAQVVVPLSGDDFEAMDQAAGKIAPALRNGATRYAAENLAVPLGGSLPALLSNDDIEAVTSWEMYDELVENTWQGAASEPSASGWAGAMFLWRASSAKNWLFGRDDMQPLVETEPYVEALRLMVSTHEKYQFKRQTPGQIWEGVKSGQWRGGVGFPQVRIESEGDFQIMNLPGRSEIAKVLLDPFSPVMSLSATCRQSAAAKRFMQWICGGEGSDTIRQQVSGMTEIGSQDGLGAVEAGQASGYDQWLAQRLSTPVTLPTLQLLRVGEYYDVLDQQVGFALAGEITPEAALAGVAGRWQSITEEVGLEKQLRTWRRAQGMRA